jgi:1,4-dihydroxy-2-naphthoate octaprenyltransferase
MIIWFVEPGILEQIINTGELVNEKLTEGTIVSFALWWIIPLSMALLTQVLNYTLNHWLNVILGVICALGIIFYFISNLLAGWFKVANFLVLLFMLIISVLITWQAWKLPKE